MRVIVANLHAGVTGWGVPTVALETVLGLEGDVLVLPELWRSASRDDVAILESAGYHGTFSALADAERVTSGPAHWTWQPLRAHVSGEHGLYFSEHRDLKPSQHRRRRQQPPGEHGEWGLGCFTRLPVRSSTWVELERLPREKVRRAVVITRLDWDGEELTVVALHGPHLSHGAHRTYRAIRRLCDELTGEVIIAGDFNSWRPPLRVFLPGWRSLARRRTWPMRLPHSQIDHVLTRSARLRTLAARAVVTGSDHRALVIDLTR